MNYDEQIAGATAQQEFDGTAWEHLNPDFTGGAFKEPPTLERGSHRSWLASEMNAALAAQELLNRGHTSMDCAYGLRQTGGGWTLWFRDAHWFVTDEEVEKGVGGVVGPHHEALT